MTFTLKLRACLLSALGGMILAFGLYNIHSFSGVTEGGVLGLCLLFEHHFSLSPAISGLILNAVCYLIGWRLLGHNFIGYSIISGGAFSLFYAVFVKLPPIIPDIGTHPLLAAVLGAIFVGIGVGISVRAGGAPSGDDALAMSLSKALHIDIKWAYLISDLSVLALSLSYIPLRKILFSLISVVLSGQIIDLIQKIKKDSPVDAEAFEMRDVLCGTLRNCEQLESCLKHKFYHIPAIRLNSGDFPLHYIAIYQSHHKFGPRAGIIYYGEIEKYALVPRRDISEVPRISDEMYYRFDIKEWKTLSAPISSDSGDFVNMTTSLYLLTHAKKTSELFLSSKDELELYQKIEKLISGEISKISSASGNEVLKLHSENLTVFRNGEESFSISLDDYKKKPLSSFRYILREFK